MIAQELRLGNIVHSPDTDKWIRVELAHLEFIYRGLGFNDKLYEPVELTEEWLTKFGFKEESSSRWFNRDKSDIYIAMFAHAVSGGEPRIIFAIGQEVTHYLPGETPEHKLQHHLIFGVQLGFVHQLQNLYFALTQKELEIK